MYKLFSIDLDNTLLNSNKKISKKDLESISLAQSKGYLICINTARNFSSSIELCQEVNADYLIYLQGCYIYDLKNKFHIGNNLIDFWRYFIFYSFPYRFISNKYLGLKRLCKYISIDMRQTVSIGDSLIDLDMIKKSGLGIYVANSRTTLKKFADYTTFANNDNSAVSEAINYALLKDNKNTTL